MQIAGAFEEERDVDAVGAAVARQRRVCDLFALAQGDQRAANPDAAACSCDWRRRSRLCPNWLDMVAGYCFVQMTETENRQDVSSATELAYRLLGEVASYSHQ